MMLPRAAVLAAALAVLLTTSTASAHITPPVVLVSDRDAVASLLSGARRLFVREVRLGPADRDAVRKQVGWSPDEDFYRFYLGRDDAGRLVAAVVFLTEFSIHGPVRVAVAVGPDGKVKGAAVTEVTEETYVWVKPLIDQNFTKEFVGQGATGQFAVNAPGGAQSMPRFYGQLIAGLVQRGAALVEVAVPK
jgi:Na+-translocating ferredoxin:NAD+ oxidoreductase RnfG subunit